MTWQSLRTPSDSDDSHRGQLKVQQRAAGGNAALGFEVGRPTTRDDWDWLDDFPYLQHPQGKVEKEGDEEEGDEANEEQQQQQQYEEATRDDGTIASGPLFEVENWRFVPMPHLGIFNRSSVMYMTDDEFEAIVPALKAVGCFANRGEDPLEEQEEKEGEEGEDQGNEHLARYKQVEYWIATAADIAAAGDSDLDSPEEISLHGAWMV